MQDSINAAAKFKKTNYNIGENEQLAHITVSLCLMLSVSLEMREAVRIKAGV